MVKLLVAFMAFAGLALATLGYALWHIGQWLPFTWWTGGAIVLVCLSFGAVLGYIGALVIIRIETQQWEFKGPLRNARSAIKEMRGGR